MYAIVIIFSVQIIFSYTYFKNELFKIHLTQFLF